MAEFSRGAERLRSRFESVDDDTAPLVGKILLAEDNPINQRLMTVKLNELGLDVDVVSDGQAAVEMFGRRQYDLVLMDVSMPGLDGVEAARQIKRTEDRSRTPVIALTAHALKGDRDRFLSQGMDDYIPKPVDFGYLYRLLRRYLPTEENPAATLRRRVPLTSSEAQDLLRGFAGRAGNLLTQLKQAMADDDRRELFRITHNLKGTAANLGLDRIAELAEQIQPTDQASSRAAIAGLEQEIDGLRSSLVAE